MTKKDYVKFAKAIKETAKNNADLAEAIYDICVEIFREERPEFDEIKFAKKCGFRVVNAIRGTNIFKHMGE